MSPGTPERRSHDYVRHGTIDLFGALNTATGKVIGSVRLFNCPELAAEFGVPEGGKHPQLRVVALLQAGTMRWKAAAIGGYHDGENALADQMEGALGPGQLSLADRLLLHDRWLRFSPGAHLLWRVKNAARSVPFRQLRTLKDGSELVLLRESGGMLGKRRRDAGDGTLARLKDTVARLVCFTVLTRTRRGRTKTAAIRVLTTMLDPGAFPAAEIGPFTQLAGRYHRRTPAMTLHPPRFHGLHNSRGDPATSNSASLEAEDLPRRTIQPQVRTKMR